MHPVLLEAINVVAAHQTSMNPYQDAHVLCSFEDSCQQEECCTEKPGYKVSHRNHMGPVRHISGMH